MTTHNTPANDGQILTDERALFEERYQLTTVTRAGFIEGRYENVMVQFSWEGWQVGRADLRASFAAVPASEPVAYIWSYKAYSENSPDGDDGYPVSKLHSSHELAASKPDEHTPLYIAAPAPVSGMPDLAHAFCVATAGPQAPGEKK